MRDTFWVIFTDIEVFLCKYESSFKKSWFLYLYIILKTARWNHTVILSLWKICNKNRKCNWFYEMHGERESLNIGSMSANWKGNPNKRTPFSSVSHRFKSIKQDGSVPDLSVYNKTFLIVFVCIFTWKSELAGMRCHL